MSLVLGRWALHKPSRDSHYWKVSDGLKAKLAVEADVLAFVCFQITDFSRVIEMRTIMLH